MHKLVFEWVSEEEEEVDWVRGLMLYKLVDKSMWVFAQKQSDS